MAWVAGAVNYADRHSDQAFVKPDHDAECEHSSGVGDKRARAVVRANGQRQKIIRAKCHVKGETGR